MHGTNVRDARIVVVALCAALTVLIACGGKKEAAQATPIPRPDPRALLNEAADRVEQARSFHFLLEHERGNTPIVLQLQMTRAEGDVVKPDRLRADIDAQRGGVRLKLKLVSIGEQSKISNPFNPTQYVDLPTGTRLSDVFNPTAGTTAALRGVKEPQITGEETLDGRKVWRVEGSVEAASLSALVTLAEGGYTAKGTVWIGQESKEVYRVRLEGPLGSQDTPDVVRVLSLSRYNEAVDITPVP
jgi:hypothetical protein